MDFTSASTTMMLDIERKCWSEPLLSLAGLTPSFLPPLQHPGEVIGKVQAKASEETGIPKGTPVVVTGHDTQFAIVGSLASPEAGIEFWHLGDFRAAPSLLSGFFFFF